MTKSKLLGQILLEEEYRTKLARVRFTEIDLAPTRIYRVEDARELLTQSGVDVDAIAPHVEGKFMSTFVRARKPFLGERWYHVITVCDHANE